MREIPLDELYARTDLRQKAEADRNHADFLAESKRRHEDGRLSLRVQTAATLLATLDSYEAGSCAVALETADALIALAEQGPAKPDGAGEGKENRHGT